MNYCYKCSVCGRIEEEFRTVEMRAIERACPSVYKGRPDQQSELFDDHGLCIGRMKFQPIQKTSFKIKTQADDGKEYM